MKQQVNTFRLPELKSNYKSLADVETKIDLRQLRFISFDPSK